MVMSCWGTERGMCLISILIQSIYSQHFVDNVAMCPKYFSELQGEKHKCGELEEKLWIVPKRIMWADYKYYGHFIRTGGLTAASL